MTRDTPETGKATPGRAGAGSSASDYDYHQALLGIVAHELRTPVSTVVGAAATLKRIGFAHPDAPAMLESLARGAKQVQRLLDDLLDLDRIRVGAHVRRTASDVPALVYRVLGEADIRDREVAVAVEPVTASLDGAKFERILANMLDNAIKHTPAGTPIWIKVSRHREGILLVVEDAGSGLRPPLKDRVFRPYVRGAGGPGTGFGLEVVGKFAEAHGGRAWVQDRPGGGASFQVYLPAHTESHWPAREVSLTPPRSRLG